MRALAAEGHEVVVVHGAGAQITEEMERRGLEVRFVGGRRVTSAEALAVVRESLRERERRALRRDRPRGGARSRTACSPRVRVPDLGLVGEPLPAAPKTILDALAAGRIPVVAPLARGPLNVNGDEAAAALAVGLGADRLLFVSDVPGVLVEGAVAESIAADDAERLVDAGAFAGGIVPKLLAAAGAARLGVPAEIGETAVTA